MQGTDLVPGRYLKDRFQLVDSYRVSLAAGLSCHAETGYTPGASMGALTGDTTWIAAAVWMITQHSGSDGCPGNLPVVGWLLGDRGYDADRLSRPPAEKKQGDREIGQAS